MPGKPAPTESTGRPCRTSAISWRMRATISSAGMDMRSIGSPGPGYIRTSPNAAPSTIPTQMWRVARTPMLLGMLDSSKPHQLVEAVECRQFIALGQRGIVEHRVHEVIHRALQDHHGLPDVQQFRGLFSNDVYSQNLARFAVENQLQPPRGIAADLPARAVAVVRHAHLIRHIFVGQLLFGFAGERNLGY